MSKFEVNGGYYAWNILRDGDLICTIDDIGGSLAERVTEADGSMISLEDLRALCTDYLDAILEEARDEEKDEPFSKSEKPEIARALFTAWARHFGYDNL